MEEEIVVVDLFLVVIFLAILPLSFNAADAAAALARVKRIDPVFSSFSLLTARCLTVRACYTNQHFCSITARLNLDSSFVGARQDYTRSMFWLRTGGILLLHLTTSDVEFDSTRSKVAPR